MNPPIITLLTDFGTRDHYVAAMKGVILGICPDTRLIDVTHEVEPFAIGEGAFLLAQTWRYFPSGTVHLVVVDPGVGTSRRAMAAEADGQFFVAPDNGVLTMVMRSAGAFRVRHITEDRFFRKPVSGTFHGRDVFSPVAAHLASGVGIEEFGPEMADPVMLEMAEPVEVRPGVWEGAVLHVDRFGNAVTNYSSERFGWVEKEPFVARAGAGEIREFGKDYDSHGEGRIFLIPGSSGLLEVSEKKGSAARQLGLVAGTGVRLWMTGADWTVRTGTADAT